MSKIFTRTFRVRWAEMDSSGAVAPSHYLRYIVETAWDWGVAIGWDADYSKNTDVFWLIREADIQFLHPLRHNDVFDLTIWLASWQRVRGTRCFELKLKESSEVIAQGTQQVVYMDAGSFIYSFTPYHGFLPSDLKPGDAGAQLRYVYFAACFAGYLGSDWEQALTPVEVRTYVRISYVEEHFVWVWLKGAKTVWILD